jgi:hypothetical protein
MSLLGRRESIIDCTSVAMLDGTRAGFRSKSLRLVVGFVAVLLPSCTLGFQGPLEAVALSRLRAITCCFAV